MIGFPVCARVVRMLVVPVAVLFLVSLGESTGFTPAQLRTALESAGVERVIRALTFSGSSSEYLLVYGGTTGGKLEIFIFRDDSLSSGHAGLKLDWESGVLPDELLVTVSGMPYVEIMDNHDMAILFSGCMPHNCPGKLGAIVYSTLRRELFEATYDAAVTPRLRYSPNVLIEKNGDYRKLLDGMLREHNIETGPK
jgi:hypothetical protein